MTGAAHAADIITTEPVIAPIAAAPPAGGFYFSMHGGFYFVDDPDVTFNIGGLGPVAAVTSTDDGYRIGGSVGYDFNELMGAEAEISYIHVGVDSFDAGAFGILPADGDAGLLTLMGNVIVGQDMGAIRPYIGAGAGGANLSLDVDLAAAGLNAVDESQWTWAAQVFAGADFQLNDRTSIGGRYRYQWIGSTDYTDTGGNPVALDQFGGHSIEAVLKVSFGN